MSAVEQYVKVPAVRLHEPAPAPPGPAPTGEEGRKPHASPASSVVIPVFNGAATVATVVETLLAALDDDSEIVLVDDFSQDDSEGVCHWLAERYPGRIVFVQLNHNVGEQRAVLIGLAHSRGRWVAIVDDDGQQSAEDVARMFDAAESGKADVVFARYPKLRHAWHRRLASQLYNCTAGWLFDRPPGLYLSSFKVVNRFLVDVLCRFDGPLVNLDAMIFQATRRYSVLDVQHQPRLAGRSGYTYRKLFGLWLETCLGFSTLPFRTAMAAGAATASLGAIAAVLCMLGTLPLAGIWPSILLVALAAVLFYLGLLGECFVRLNRRSIAGQPAVVRYVFRKVDGDA
jgi:undecaprenyl-phosphate 4-deoxy-4-formamido-L-arabinose transferase